MYKEVTRQVSLSHQLDSRSALWNKKRTFGIFQSCVWDRQCLRGTRAFAPASPLFVRVRACPRSSRRCARISRGLNRARRSSPQQRGGGARGRWVWPKSTVTFRHKACCVQDFTTSRRVPMATSLPPWALRWRWRFAVWRTRKSGARSCGAGSRPPSANMAGSTGTGSKGWGCRGSASSPSRWRNPPPCCGRWRKR